MYQFRDPIHGFIPVSEEELCIINSPPFQRLRNIHQLATTYLVYHGAEHTRPFSRRNALDFSRF